MMGLPFRTPPAATCKAFGYDGRFEQAVDELMSRTWHLSLLGYPVATKINDPEMMKQQFDLIFHRGGNSIQLAQVYIETLLQRSQGSHVHSATRN